MLNSYELRTMIEVPATTVRLGLTDEEADRLADELARMEEELSEPGLAAFAVFDRTAAIARRREWLAAAMPAHEVRVDAFRIDVYPVTHAQWRVFVAETAGKPVATPANDRVFVTGVAWKEAQAYALHYGLDLPTEAEWEAAARADRRLFTWGDSYFPQGDIAFAPPVDAPYEVGTRPSIASAHGVHDLLGHFGEYCWDPFGPYPGADRGWWERHFPGAENQRVVRGGYDVHQDATCVSRRGVPPDERRGHIKFRCVRRT